jgi:hypothetical protein
VKWFYDNCNWRRGGGSETFAVTSTKHGSPIGVASNPCETLYESMKGKEEKKRKEKNN